ncbi:unnamed protein product (macronuclear) [Paramecium tetraurelia]|uniref:Uncharacterized protein n=1 Tax=Paramecium tetraurelia TaxID=5888 RepID=A0DLD2_PARTE|nr:uncharacterized protein GSPATT00018166001 [Paramecium tetraurelia]CAK83849.1 unnamed protein product [Paramecium tetraurelia]|eukprot:XP_001451246.1 hypothetical protein (macronuclear) [Paramecium tetraurelia strain d4-2]
MNNNQFHTRQWEQQYAKHKKSVEQIEQRNNKFPDQVEEILQRCNIYLPNQEKDANKKVQNSQNFKQKEVLSRITASNLILSKKLQQIENRKQIKFIDAPIRLSTKSIRDENHNKIKVENHKQFERITQVKGTLQS